MIAISRKFIVLFFLICVLVGCRKKENPAATEISVSSSPNAVVSQEQAPRSRSGEPEKIDVPLSELTQLVRRYGMEQQKAPKSMNDLVSKGYLTSIPPVPAGKKYVITANLEVQLSP